MVFLRMFARQHFDGLWGVKTKNPRHWPLFQVTCLGRETPKTLFGYRSIISQFLLLFVKNCDITFLDGTFLYSVRMHNARVWLFFLGVLG